jgi:hypothetical protein
VLVGGGVGVAGSDGGGATVGEFVLAGGAVGATVGGADGVDVFGSGVAGGDAVAPPGAEVRGAGLPVEITTGAVVGVLLASGGAPLLAASRVKLKPARARPTASEGPRSTYKVKDARPPRPAA